jgi:hypothetical protein
MSAAGDVVKFKPFTFDYAALPAASATSLREEAVRIRELVKTATGAIIDVGLHLLAVKSAELRRALSRNGNDSAGVHSLPPSI